MYFQALPPSALYARKHIGWEPYETDNAPLELPGKLQAVSDKMSRGAMMARGSLSQFTPPSSPVHNSADLRQRVDAVRKLVNKNMSDFDEGAADAEVTLSLWIYNVEQKDFLMRLSRNWLLRLPRLHWLP